MQHMRIACLRRTLACLLACLALAASTATAGEPISFSWPEGRQAAVSLAYDDALDSQLDNAIPALDRHGFKASFYLQLSREQVVKRLDEWRAAAGNGHELGNHSLFHQCSKSPPDRNWVEPQRNLDTTTAAQMRDQVLLANAMLQAIDGRSERTYTVPCGGAMASDGNYVNLIKRDFVAIKFGEGAVTRDMAALDPYAVTVVAPVGATGAELIAMAEAAAKQGTMVNFTFHGVGGDYLGTSNEAHEALLDYLDKHRATYWVDSFINLMKYVRSQQSNMPAATSARVLRVVDDSLTAQGTGGERSRLIPISKDQFLYDDGLTRFTLQRDAGGSLTGMRFFNDGEPPGTMVPRTAEALPTARQEVPLRQQELDRVLGSYAANGMNLKVFMDGTLLKAQMGGQLPVEIFAESVDHFFLTVVDATLTFAAGKGSPAAVTLDQDGKTLQFKRIP